MSVRIRVHRAGLAAALAIGLGLLAACGTRRPAPAADPLMDVFRARAQEEGLSRSETSGKRLFLQYCATCHGDTGAGDGQNASNLDPQPASFAEALPRHPRSYWRQIVVGGTAAVGRSPLCPPWARSLRDPQVDEVVDYLQLLARPRPSPGPSPSPGS